MVAAFLLIASGRIHAAGADAQEAVTLAAGRVLAAQGTAQPAAPAQRDRDADFGFCWEEHPCVNLGKDTRLDFRVRLQFDARGSEARLAEEDSGFDVARRRVGLQGELFGVLEFEVERELGDDDPWRDVFVNYKQFDVARVQAGKFKVPFSLDQTTSPTNLDFVYRSLAAARLAPGRDRGVMVHGHPGLRSINYEVGVFEHDGANARSRDADRVTGGRTLAARVTAQPFRSSKSPLEDLQVGFATTSSDLPTGLAGLRDGTVFGESFLPSNAPVQGARRRLGLEMRWRPGPFSLKSEYMRVTTERLGQSVEDTDLSPLVASGWYVSGTWVLTGEAKARGLDRPRRPLLGGGPGAIEIAARVERLAFGSAAHDDVPSRSPRADVIVGNGDRAITAGVNWYPSRWIKVQFNVIQERLDDPGLGPLPGQSAFWSHVVRLQVTL